ERPIQLETRLGLHPLPLFLQLGTSSLRLQNPFLQFCRPWRFSSPFLFADGPLFGAFLRALLSDCFSQSLSRGSPVHRLRTRILYRHANSRGPMTQRDRCRNFVHVLTARAGGTRKRLLQVRFVKKIVWVTHDEGRGGS